MNKIFFDYKLDLEIIRQENELDLTTLDIYKLKNMFNGRIYVFFDYNNSKNRNFMFLNTGILDYILQFDNMFSYIDKGNTKTFTVSCDYYSNSLDFTYSKLNDSLEIYEVNSSLYTIKCKYKDLKKEYNKFRKKTLDELIIYYPQLEKNKIFIEHLLLLK